MKPYVKFFEKRSHPEQNPHIGAWDYVEKYKNDPDVYISFTEIDKIGINPRSTFNTPIGIYTFPLKEFVKKYLIPHNYKDNTHNASIGSYSPWAGNAAYVNFIKIKPEAKATFINDMYEDYGSDKYDKDIKILEKKYGAEELTSTQKQNFIKNMTDRIKYTLENLKSGKDKIDYSYFSYRQITHEIEKGDKDNIFNTLNHPYQEDIITVIHRNLDGGFDENKFKDNMINLMYNTGSFKLLVRKAIDEAKEKNSVMSMWNITRLLAKSLSQNEKQASTKWNLILNRDLGYSGFADKSGKGYIHPSEPTQAVFFSTSAFDVITRIENKPAKTTGFPIKIGDKFKKLFSDKPIIYTILDIAKNRVTYSVNSTVLKMDLSEFVGLLKNGMIIQIE